MRFSNVGLAEKGKIQIEYIVYSEYNGEETFQPLMRGLFAN